MNTIRLLSGGPAISLGRVTQRAKSRSYAHTFLHFEEPDDAPSDPVMVTGRQRTVTSQFSTAFFARERADADALVAMLTEAMEGSDHRLVVAVEGSEFFPDDSQRVVIPEWSEPHEAGGVTTVTFTATKVP